MPGAPAIRWPFAWPKRPSTSSSQSAGTSPILRSFSLPKGVTPDRLKVQLVSKQPLLAPVAKGTVVGTLRLTLDGQPYGEHAVYATDDVPLAGFIGRSWDSIKMLFQ